MNVIILHGTLGNPEINWFPWLDRELTNRGHQVVRPQLPTPGGQTLANWVQTIKQSTQSISSTGEIILVAHSLAPLAACHYLTERDNPIFASFFVAPFAEKLPHTPEPYPTLNNPFIEAPIDWEKVKDNCRRFFCFAGDNDPYVPIEMSRHFAKNLGAKLIVIPEAGHMNEESGYTRFPLLLDALNSTIKS